MTTRTPRRALAAPLAALVGLASSGCVAGPAARTAPAPGAVASAAGEAAPTPRRAPPPDLGPLDLAAALERARAANPDLRAAAARIELAGALAAEAESAFYPQLSARLGWITTDEPQRAFGLTIQQRRFKLTDDFNDPDPQTGFRPELVLGWSVFAGGRDAARRRAALLGIDAAQLERTAVRNAIAAATASAFYLAHAAREQTGVAAASVAAVERALADARVRLDAGTGLRSDVLSLEVRRAEAEELRARAENAVERVLAGLRLLLDLPPDAPVELLPPAAERPAALPEPAPSFAEALARARRDRTELAAAQTLVAIRDEQVAAAAARHWPRLELFAAYGQDDRGLELSRGQDNWSVGAMLELELFGGFRTTARVRAAEHRRAEAEAEARRTVLGVEREVREAFLDLQEARRRREVSEKAVGAAEEAFSLVEEQFESGTAIVTRLIEAEVALAGARARAIAARHDVRRAEAELARATGAWPDAEGRR